MADRDVCPEERNVMKTQTRWLLVLVLFLAAVTACEGGSVSGSHERCSHKVDSGQCTGSFKKLTGTYTLDVENDRIFNNTPVEVRVQVSVESGPLKVWVKSPGDEITSVEVSSGQTATLTGVAVGVADEFGVKFQAPEEQAEGISYEITYQIR
jgi:hypothetical protein